MTRADGGMPADTSPASREREVVMQTKMVTMPMLPGADIERLLAAMIAAMRDLLARRRHVADVAIELKIDTPMSAIMATRRARRDMR